MKRLSVADESGRYVTDAMMALRGLKGPIRMRASYGGGKTQIKAQDLPEPL